MTAKSRLAPKSALEITTSNHAMVIRTEALEMPPVRFPTVASIRRGVSNITRSAPGENDSSNPSSYQWADLLAFFGLLGGRTYRDQREIEHQRLVRRDRTTGPAGAIGKVRRYNEFPLITLPHELEGLGPARDQLVNGELRGHPRLCRVKHLAVDQHALVIDAHQVGGI